MVELIDVFNSYKNELGWTIKKVKPNKKYLYHAANAKYINSILENGLIPSYSAIDTHIAGMNYTPRTFPSYMTVKKILLKLKVVYVARYSDSSIYQTFQPNSGNYHEQYSMFRFPTNLVNNYLYDDPENYDSDKNLYKRKSIDALICLVNIPPQYLELGLPTKIKRKTDKLGFEYYDYDWVKFNGKSIKILKEYVKRWDV